MGFHLIACLENGRSKKPQDDFLGDGFEGRRERLGDSKQKAWWKWVVMALPLLFFWVNRYQKSSMLASSTLNHKGPHAT